MNKHERGKFGWSKVCWILGLLAWVIVSLVATQFVVSFLMLWILGDVAAQPVWSTVYSAIVYTLCLLLTVLVPWKLFRMKTSRDELGLTGLPTWTDILLSPVGFAAYFVLAILLVALAGIIFPGINWSQAQEVGYDNLILVSDRILAFTALVVVAPIAEEIIFRGWLYGKMRTKVSAWAGILAVSLVFGLLHLGFDINALQWNVAVNVFFMSVVMCVMREITGTIWSGMLLHILKNGVAFYLLFILGTY